MAAKSAGHIACPKCGQKYRWNPDKIGKNVNCVKCGHVFAMPEEPLKKKAPASAAPTDRPKRKVVRKPVDKQDTGSDASVSSASDLRSQRSRRKLGNKPTTAVSKKSLFEDDEVLSQAFAAASDADASATASRSASRTASKSGLSPVDETGESGIQADPPDFDEASIAEGIKGLEREVNKEALLEEEGPRWWVPVRDYFLPAAMVIVGILLIFPVFHWGTARQYDATRTQWQQDKEQYDADILRADSAGADASRYVDPGPEPTAPGIVTVVIKSVIVVVGSLILAAGFYVLCAIFLGMPVNDGIPVALLKLAGIVLFPAAGGIFLIIISGDNAFLGLGHLIIAAIAVSILFQLDFFRLGALSIMVWIGYIASAMIAIKAI